MQLFPFTMYARDNGHYVHSPRLAETIWLRKRDGRTWYATDCEVTSEKSITLRIYCMADSFHGGIGEKIHEMEVTDFTQKEQDLLAKAIENRATYLAQEEFVRLQEEKANQEVLALRKKLFGI